MKKEAKIKNSHAEFKANLERETRVLLEEVRQQFETVAEGHSSLVKKLEQHDQRFDRLEAATLENSREIRILKGDVQLLKEGQKRIEEKLDCVIINHEERLQKLEVIVKV